MISPDLLSRISELIRLRTTADQPEALIKIIDLVETYFRDTDLFVTRYESGGKPSIVISTVSTHTPDILMIGHLDVVAASDELFEPRVENHRLYGRGACDMKSEDAVMMGLLREYSTQTVRPSLALMLTTDEEIGGKNGMGYLIDEVGYRCKVALVPDGGEAFEDLILKNKGILHVELSASGVSAHGARPWLGKNAIEALYGDYERIRALFPPSTQESDWQPTCNLGVISGGHAINQVPDHCSGKIDIRFTEVSRPEKLLADIQACATHSTVNVIAQASMSQTASSNPFVQTYTQVFQKKTGRAPIYGQSHGANDGRYLTAHDIPIIVSRPLSGGQHSPTEWVDLNSLHEFEDLYRKTIQAFQEACT